MILGGDAKVLRISKLLCFSLLSTFISVVIAPSVFISSASASNTGIDTYQYPNQITENAYMGGGYTFNQAKPPTASSALGTQCANGVATGGGGGSAGSTETTPYLEWLFTPSHNNAGGCSTTGLPNAANGITGVTSTAGELVHYTSYIYDSNSTKIEMCEVSNMPMYATVNGSLMLNDWSQHNLPSKTAVQSPQAYNQTAMGTGSVQNTSYWSQQSIITVTEAPALSKAPVANWSNGYKLDVWGYFNSSNSYMAIYFDNAACDGYSQDDTMHDAGSDFFFTSLAPGSLPAVTPQANVAQAQTISFPSTSATYGYGSANTLNASAPGSGTITYTVATGTTVCTVSSNIVTIKATSGTCTINASIAADGFYSTASTTTPLTITATKGTPTVTATAANITYGGNIGGASTVTGLASGDTFSGVVLTYTSTGSTPTYNSTSPPTALGTYTLTPSGGTLAGSTGTSTYYNAASYNSANFTISKAPITTAAIPVTAPVTGSTPINATSDNGQYSTTITWSGSPSTFAASTTYTATITIVPDTDYTVTGVASNLFTVSGATTVSYTASSTTVTATFPATTAIASPGAPTIGTATATGATTATVAYTAPSSNGGAAITTYTATSSPGGITGSVSQATSGTITVSGLSPNTTYTFTVTAYNGTGTSVKSANSNSITTQKALVSSAAIPVPVPVTGNTPATSTSDNGQYSTTITWSTSPSTFAGSTAYTATITVIPDSAYTLTGLSSNFFTVSGATSVTTSSATVTAVFPKTTAITAPGAPTIGTATATGATTATVAYTAPSSNGGAAITTYTATSSPGGITGSVSQATSGTITVSGLSPNTTYTFTVTAYNGTGTSANSSASNSITTPKITITTSTINLAAPVTGGTPVTSIPDNGQFSATVTWSGNPSTFAGSTGYEATITIVPDGLYTVNGIAANFFTDTAASSISNGASSNTVTADFPQTSAPLSSQTITFSSTAPSGAVVGGATYSVAASGGSSGNAVTFTIDSSATSICSVSGSTVSFTAVGTCEIDANQLGNSTYAAATQATQSFSVGKGTPTFGTFTITSKTYGGSSFALTAPTVTGSLAGSWVFTSGTTSVATISSGTVTIVSAGTSTITGTFTPTDTTDYNSAITTATLTVNGAPITITAGSPSTNYTGSAVVPSNSVSVTSGSLVGSDSVSSATYTYSSSSYLSSTTAPTNVGTYTITPSAAVFGTGSASNYAITYSNGSLTINAVAANAPTSVSATSGATGQSVVSWTAPTSNGGDPISDYTVQYSSNSGGAWTSFTHTASTSTSMTVTGLTNGTSYIFRVAAVTSVGLGAYSSSSSAAIPKTVINTSNIVLTAPVAGAVPQSSTSDNGQFTTTETWSGSPSTFAANTIYTASITVVPDAAYTLTNVSATFFTVNSNAATTANTASAGTLTYRFATTGKLSSTTTYSASTTTPTYGNSVTLTATETTGATGTVTFKDGSSNTLCTTGTLSAGAAHCSWTPAAATTYSVTATYAGDTNYASSSSSAANVVVGQVPITITVGSPSTTYTGSVVSPTNNFAITSGSMVGSDTITAVTYTYSPSSPKTVGTYTLTPSAAVFGTGSSSNYSLTYVAGTLTINKASQAITMSTPPGSSSVGGTYTPTASGGGSGNGVSITLDPSSTGCTLTLGVVAFTAVGTCKIDSNQSGSSNYSDATQVQQSITITAGTQAALSFTVSPTSAQYNGSAYSLDPVFTPSGGSGAGTITYSITSGGTATGCNFSGGVLTASTYGTCIFTATKSSDANFNSITASPVTFTFAQATQLPLTITSTSGSVGTALDLTYTGGSGTGAISYSTDTSGCHINDISGTWELTADSALDCSVTVLKNADADYLSTYTTTGVGMGKEVSTVSVALDNNATTADLNVATNLTVTTNTPGVVSLTYGGSAISGCTSITMVLDTYTCAWTPLSVNSGAALTAAFTPTDSSYSSSSNSLEISVIASSLGGIPIGDLTNLFSQNVDASTSAEIRTSDTNSQSNSGWDLVVPSGAFSQATQLNVYLVTGASLPNSGPNLSQYLLNFVVEWHALNGQPINANIPLSITVSNSSIKKGMAVYIMVGSTPKLLGTAIADGSITANLSADPQLVIAPTVPDAPTGITATPSDGSTTISWTPPANNGGSAITGYTVTASGSGGSCTTPDGSTYSCSISGLTNGTAYTFSVVATNAVGNSVASSSSTPVTPAAVPSAPSSVSATIVSTKGVSLGFIAGDSNGSNITGYSVTSSPSVSGGLTVSGSRSPLTVVGAFVQGQAYTFQIVEENSAGSSSASLASNSVTPNPSTVPDAPSITSATSTSSSSASVSFTAPSNNGGSTILDYTVTSSPGGFTGTGSGTPITVSGLSPNTSYTFTVTARNAVGSSAASSPSNSVTTAASSDATLSSLGVSSGSLSPSFTSSTTSYSVAVAGSVSSITVTPTANQSGASITVNGTSVSSGNASGAISLTVGSNTIHVNVTAQDGTTTQSYILTITRALIPISTSDVSVAAPVSGGAPQTTVTDNGQFSATVAWSGNPSTFLGGTSYTATVTIVPDGQYTLNGVSANFFTVNSNTATSPNSANAGVFTYTFPTTATSASTTTLVVFTNSTTYGVVDTLTATVSSGASGTVTFSDGSQTLCTNAAISGGQAICDWLPAHPGFYSIIAQYSGDSGFAGSNSLSVGVTINQATPTLSGMSIASVNFGAGPITLTDPIVSPAIAGTISYSSGTTSVATVSGNVVTVVGSGTSLITATFTPTDSTDYNSVQTSASLVVGSTTPSAPNSALAVAGDGQAVISWGAPSSNGGSPISGYTVTSNPTGFNCTVLALTCTISGLTNGQSYTFTVTATNAASMTSAGATTSAVTPSSVIASAMAPIIDTAPTSFSASLGQLETLTVTAHSPDTGTLSYQWNLNGASISGANSANYSFVVGASTASDQYTVTVTNYIAANGTSDYVTTSPVSLIVAAALSINTPVSGLTATIGFPYSLSVAATGGTSPYTYGIASGASALAAAGLSLNTGSGVISGTPTQTGTISTAISVVDSTTASATTSTFNIVIGLDPDAISPTFDTPVQTSTGFTVNVTNYNVSFIETATVSAGTITDAIPSGAIWALTVSGLTSGESATVTVSAGQSGYVTESASITSGALGYLTQTPAPMPAPDPVQDSSISSITEVCGTTEGTEIVIKGSFVAHISRISLNDRILDPSAWIVSATEVDIPYNSNVAKQLEVQIYNGHAPVLPLESINYVPACGVVAAPPVVSTPPVTIMNYGVVPPDPVAAADTSVIPLAEQDNLHTTVAESALNLNNGLQLNGSSWSISLGATDPSSNAVVSMVTSGSTGLLQLQIEEGANLATTGSGFRPNSTVTVYIFSTAIVLGSVQTDSQGAFQSSVILPSELESGTHKIQVTGWSPAGTKRIVTVPVLLSSATVIKQAKSLKVYFPLNSHTLSASSIAKVENFVASSLASQSSQSKMYITVIGYVQPTVPNPQPALLSKNRAIALETALKQSGLKGHYLVLGGGVEKLNSPLSRYAVVTISYK